MIFALAMLASAGTAGAAKTVYVDGKNGNNAWDGLCETWDGGSCGPKKTIQAGINAAVNGDQVLVANAVYAGEGNTDLNFFGRAITLKSINGPDYCIIDGTDGEDPAFRFEYGEEADTVLDGFTITNFRPC
ncbi:MAG: hypothetical protein JSV91_00150 [Phycisphaerales bacterium]|nr:MAG: hypothetical protein JSV91_00150 [Phycisphaerales bacterium]